LEFKNLPCSNCKLVIPVKSEFCQYCGAQNFHSKGSVAKTIGWLKNVTGKEKRCNKNLFSLEKELDARIKNGVSKIDQLKKQTRAILKATGLEEKLLVFRSDFLKFGGGSLKQLVKESGQKAEIGSEYFTKLTDFDRLVDSTNLQNSIDNLIEMISILKSGLDKCQDFNIFVPRSAYKQLLQELFIFLEKLQGKSSHLSNTSQTMRTIAFALSMLQEKIMEYRFILYGVQIELWIAQANQIFYQVLLPESRHSDPSSQIESLKSSGERLMFKIKDDFSQQKKLDTTEFFVKIEEQMTRLEEGKVACIASQAMETIEKFQFLGDYTMNQDLENLETKAVPPAILLYQSFEKAKEEEIRLLSQKKVKDKL
jgi:hypothetical protein